MEYTKYQKDIFEFVEKDSKNLIIQACAGSGKTTTIVKSCDPLIGRRVLLTSFSNLIVGGLKEKAPWGVEAATLNSVGFRILRENSTYPIKVDKFKDWNILREVMRTKGGETQFHKIKGVVGSLIGLLKNNLVLEKEGIARNILELIKFHALDIPKEFDGGKLEGIVEEVYWRSLNENIKGISFDDQKLLVVKERIPVNKYGIVLVDETQDLSPLDMAFIERIGERKIFCGDRFQAIYLFRGAMCNSMDTIKDSFEAVELPLSICFRCPEKVINEAKLLCSVIESPTQFNMENRNGEGVVDSIKKSKFKEMLLIGDYRKKMVVCRTTAPLIKECMAVMGDVPCYVKGREIGEGLERIIGVVSENNLFLEISEFDKKLVDYYSEQSDRLRRLEREEALGLLDDQIDGLRNGLVPKCRNVGELIGLVREKIVDNGEGVAFLTGHKSKGLENKEIYWLRKDQCPHKRAKTDEQLEQENNLQYVMTTRSQEKLFYVEKEIGEK